MSYPRGAWVVIICCFLLHFGWFSADVSAMLLFAFKVQFPIAVTQCITYITFPVLGWLADTRLSHYMIIRIAAIAESLVSVLGLVVTATIITLYSFHKEDIERYVEKSLLLEGSIIGLPYVAIIVIVGMFEANAIQFGLNQMQEASSQQLSAFIHWYYWSINLSRALMLATSVCIQAIQSACVIDFYITRRLHTGILPAEYVVLMMFLGQSIMSIVAVLLLCYNKKLFNIDKTGYRPFILVYRVLKYAWKHKCPERRSAFTYWEEDIPSRINLGKSKYGGPFTTEEVEDTKSFFRILLVILSLFGLHVASNGYSLMNHLFRTLCPTVPTFISVLTAPNMLSSLSIVISVPVFHYLVLPLLGTYIPNMIHRMGLCLAGVLLVDLYWLLFVLYTTNEYSGCTDIKDSRNCFLHNTPFLINGTCKPLTPHTNFCGQDDSLFIWMLLPIATHSFFYQFAFMTALEFICAQAPLRMKGLLIGLWYATSAIHVQTHFANTNNMDDKSWFIYEGINCSLTLLSLLIYCYVGKQYQYRVRGEVVNFNYLVEEIYERQLHQQQEYERCSRVEEEQRPLIRGQKMM